MYEMEHKLVMFETTNQQQMTQHLGPIWAHLGPALLFRSALV